MVWMSDRPDHSTAALRETPLHALHRELGARMAPFAGYDMPIHYPSGVLREHLHVRDAAGLFDVSHMGQIEIESRSGDIKDAARDLERLIPIDILGLAPGRQRYGLLTNDEGGILDDLMVARIGDRLILVINAANRAADEAHLRKYLHDRSDVLPIDRVLLALQGPRAEVVLEKLVPSVRDMRFMDMREIELMGALCLISRSGYTGDDGFEISIPKDRAVEIARVLLADENVQPIGLGARDSLRLEAGLCLHGADIDTETSPIEAALAWSIPAVRRAGGKRAGGFPGATKILRQIEHGVHRTRVGLRTMGRAPVRADAPLFACADDVGAVGRVTSGCFGPSVQAPIAMGYLPPHLARLGQERFAEVRGQRLALMVAPLPFVSPRFKRS